MPPTHWPETAQKLTIPGPTGALELAVGAAIPGATRLAVICHPHSLHGGTMDNKVVTMLERTLRDAGVATVRFNFRGVGGSGGVFDDGEGEGDDLATVVALARGRAPEAQLWLAGFSFGSFVAARMAAVLGAQLLISVAPPVGRFAFRSIARPPCPWIVLMGEIDEVVDPAQVFEHFEHMQPPVELLRFGETGHFFHGKLVEMRQRLGALLERYR